MEAVERGVDMGVLLTLLIYILLTLDDASKCHFLVEVVQLEYSAYHLVFHHRVAFSSLLPLLKLHAKADIVSPKNGSIRV